MKPEIMEHQQGLAPWRSSYIYLDFDPKTGLHRFADELGQVGLYARTKSAPAGWHLRRGGYCFEFVRSA